MISGYIVYQEQHTSDKQILLINTYTLHIIKMKKNSKNAVAVSNEIPAIEVQSVEAVVATMEAPVPAKKKRRHARKAKATRMNIVHVTKASNTVSNTVGNVTTRTTTSTTTHTLLTTIESSNAKEFTLKLATYFAQNPSDLNTNDIIYQKAPKAE